MTEELITQLKEGKADAFKTLYNLYADKVYGTAVRMLGSEADAADVAQEVFLTLSQKIGSFQGRSSLSTWIYRIAVNASLDRRRKMKATAIRSIDDLLDTGGELSQMPSANPSSPGEQIDREILRVDVRGAIASLRPKLAAVITLRYGESMEYTQIAETLGCSLGTVKSRLARAHKKLMPMLSQIYEKHQGISESGEQR